MVLNVRQRRVIVVKLWSCNTQRDWSKVRHEHTAYISVQSLEYSWNFPNLGESHLTFHSHPGRSVLFNANVRLASDHMLFWYLVNQLFMLSKVCTGNTIFMKSLNWLGASTANYIALLCVQPTANGLFTFRAGCHFSKCIYTSARHWDPSIEHYVNLLRPFDVWLSASRYLVFINIV